MEALIGDGQTDNTLQLKRRLEASGSKLLQPGIYCIRDFATYMKDYIVLRGVHRDLVTIRLMEPSDYMLTADGHTNLSLESLTLDCNFNVSQVPVLMNRGQWVRASRVRVLNAGPTIKCFGFAAGAETPIRDYELDRCLAINTAGLVSGPGRDMGIRGRATNNEVFESYVAGIGFGFNEAIMTGNRVECEAGTAFDIGSMKHVVLSGGIIRNGAVYGENDTGWVVMYGIDIETHRTKAIYFNEGNNPGPVRIGPMTIVCDDPEPIVFNGWPDVQIYAAS